MSTFKQLLPGLLALTIGLAGWQALAAPPQDSCPEKTIQRDNVPFTVRGNTTPADDDGTSCTGSEGRDISYTWTAPEEGFYSFDTFGSSFDTVLTIEDGVCEGAFITCNDDFQGLDSYVEVYLGEGQEVTIIVDGFSSEAYGKFNLNIELL